MFIFLKTKKLYQKVINLVFLLIFLFLPVLVFATGTELQAPTIPEPDSVISNPFWVVVLWFFHGIFIAIGYFFFFGMKVLDFAISGELFDKVFFSDSSLIALTIGWSVVRDFFNLFFILILVFIAISIILNIDKYNDKKLIFKVATAAILVNFSKAIALVIIDISQMTMNFFSQAISLSGESFVNVFSAKIGVALLLNPSNGENISFLIVILISSIFLFCLTCLIIVLAAALVIRLVSFWVLIILSPMAMFGLALPGTAIGGMTKNWMDKMISWAFFGPLMMFFLWLALIVVSVVASLSGAITKDIGFSGVKGSTSDFLMDISSILLPFISGIYLLYYGFDLSRKTSQGAAQAVLGWGGKQTVAWTKRLGSTYAGLAAAPFAAMAYHVTDGKVKLNPFRTTESVRAAIEGTKNRITSSLGINKEEKESRYRDKVDRFSGRKGQEKAEERKIHEASAEIKDKNQKQLEAILNDKKGNTNTRIAAAKKLAKDGKLNTAASYDTAHALLSGIKGSTLRDGSIAELKKNNLAGRHASGESLKSKNAVGSKKHKAGLDRVANVKTEINKMAPKDIVNLDPTLLKDSAILAHLSATYGVGGGKNEAMNELNRAGSLKGAVAAAFKTAGIIA